MERITDRHRLLLKRIAEAPGGQLRVDLAEACTGRELSEVGLLRDLGKRRFEITDAGRVVSRS